MDAGFVREGVLADDRLVALHDEAGQRAQQAAGRVELGRVDLRADLVMVGAGAERHDDFFERCIARALADAVDRAFDLPCAAFDASQRVRNGHAQIVMAVRAEDDAAFFDVRDRVDHGFEHRTVILRRRVADRVGHVDRRRAGLDRGMHDLFQERQLGAGRVHRRKFDVARVFARQIHHRDRPVSAPSRGRT